MSKPKPRPYRVVLSRLEVGVTTIMATSIAEAEKIAWEDSNGPEWYFEAGDYVGLPKAELLKGRDAEFYRDDAYERPKEDKT